MFVRLRSLFAALRARNSFEAGMTEELRFHIERYTDDLVRSGVSAGEARRRAQMEFYGMNAGGINTVKEECRAARGLPVFDEIGRQLRHAARLLSKAPGFTATALLTFGLCLGANLAIFAVMDAVLLRPLPFPDSGRLVTLFNTYPKASVYRDGSSLTNYYERRGRIAAFSSVSIYRLGTAIVGEARQAAREPVMEISPEFFATLGRGPMTGRAFTEEETSYQTDNVVILSYRYWRQHFNAGAIGRQIRLDTFPKTVIGVLPPEFRFLSSDADLYLPLASRPEQRSPRERHSGGNVIQMIARLKPGATLEQAQAQIDAQNANLEADDPQAKMMADAGFRSLVVPLHADHVASIRPMLLLLQAGVFTLLLIGVVNVANLLLIRATGRAKEIAVRQAIGASPLYVVSEVIVETTLLTVLGGVLGLGLGAAGIRLLTWLGVDRLPLGAHVTFDGRVALVAMAAALFIGLALAAPIAWLHLRGPGNALGSESRSVTSGRAATTLRHGFVIAQIALAFVLLAGAGLLGASLKRVMAVSPGFQPDHILTAQISLVGEKYPAAMTGLAFAERLVDGLEKQPGVESAGVTNNLPFSGNNGKSAATLKGHVLRPGESPRGHYSYGIGGDYFRALGFRLRAGRFLNMADSRRRERVCVVDEDFARYYWPDANPLGRLLFQGSEAGRDSDAFTVVGVVGSVKQAGLTDEDAQGAVYYPYIYRPDNHIFVAMRAGTEPDSMRLTLERVIRQIDPDLAISDVQSMDDRISHSLVSRRSPALLAGIFCGIALLLTGIGTYGVLSYMVAQRRREIGLRMALGAEPGRIRGDFLGLTLRLLAVGVACGSAGAWLMGKAMQTVLFHVPPFSGWELGITACVMALVALAGCLAPAHRAAGISPMQALVEE